MKRYLFVLAFNIIAAATNAQNLVYDANAEVRTVESFTGIEVSGTISLYLSQGPVQGVAISAGDEKYNSKIKTEVKNGVLYLSVDGGMWNGFNWNGKKLKAYVTVVQLNRLQMSGATYVSSVGPLKSQLLSIDLSGASEIKCELNVDELNMNVSGASVAKLSGKVRNGNVDASGACVIGSYDLAVDTCKISCSGASVVRLYVKDQLVANASGGSAINYKGKPMSKVSNTGGSSIKNRDGEEN